MKKLFHDYGIPQDTMCVFCDNTNAINLSKNLVQHSKSKHIEIRYHFIKDLVEDKVVCLEFIHTKNQKVDIFTKTLDGPWFELLRKTIGVGTIPWISCVMCTLPLYHDFFVRHTLLCRLFRCRLGWERGWPEEYLEWLFLPW